jgi:hypothetical protein
MANIPYDYEEITLAGAATGLTAAKIAAWKDFSPSVLIRVADNAITWLVSGSTPTATTKNQAEIGDFIFLSGYEVMKKFLAIKRDAGTPVLAVHYFR